MDSSRQDAHDLGGDSARAVYRDLLRFGPRSRSGLSARLGLSAPTVTRVTRDLLEGGHLHPLDTVPLAKGRPQEPLDIEENLGPRFVGVKATADEIHAVVTTVRGNLLEELVLPHAATRPDDLLAAISAPVEALMAAHPRVIGVGVSLGARVAGRRSVLSSSLLHWDEPVDVGGLLGARLGLPVTVENDLFAMVQGLHWFGVGRAYRSFCVLTVGAGVAIGSVIDGRLVEGRSHLAGLTEQLPARVGPDGAVLTVGEVARLDALLDEARRRGLLTPEDGLEALREQLRAGEPGARRLVADLARDLARTASALVAVLDPEALLIGGETVDLVREADGLFEEVLRAAVHPVQRDLVIRLLSGDFDDWARGAAVIAIQQHVGVPA